MAPPQTREQVRWGEGVAMGVAEPWEELCVSCDGGGRIVVPAWAQWQEEYDRLERIRDLGARLRALTDHVLRAPAGPAEITCPDCAGEGVVVTERGRALLDFMDRRFGTRPPPPPNRPRAEGSPRPELPPPAHMPPRRDEPARPDAPGRPDAPPQRDASSYFDPPGQADGSPPPGGTVPAVDLAALPTVPPVASANSPAAHPTEDRPAPARVARPPWVPDPPAAPETGPT